MTIGGWQLVDDNWLVTIGVGGNGGNWLVTIGRWQVVGGNWLVKIGWWQLVLREYHSHRLKVAKVVLFHFLSR